MSERIRKLLRRFGIEAYRYSIQTSARAQLRRLLEHLEIDLVLDVGANHGQYAAALRAHGYPGQIVSFEPLAAAHAELTAAARNDPGWRVAPRMALGDATGEITINVSANSFSSSVLGMLPAHEQAAPGSGYVGRETVALKRLDDVAGEFLAGARKALLKIDTQGYEDRVLAGAETVLPKLSAIQAELSLIPLYAGQPLMDHIRARIEALGFVLYAVFPGHVHEVTGQTVQIDGFFVRPSQADATVARRSRKSR